MTGVVADSIDNILSKLVADSYKIGRRELPEILGRRNIKQQILLSIHRLKNNLQI
jgi:hypothetical protein